MQKKALIQYIGRAVPRVDDVLRTDRVWTKTNDILEVPADQAAHYTNHPLEWREITPSEAEQREQAKQLVAGLVNRIKIEWAPMTVEDLQELKADIDLRIADINAGRVELSEAKLEPPKAINGAEALQSEDAATRALGEQRIIEIARVLGTMDPKDKDQWTVKGPRVPVVSEKYGQKVASDEIAEALKLADIHRLAL